MTLTQAGAPVTDRPILGCLELKRSTGLRNPVVSSSSSRGLRTYWGLKIANVFMTAQATSALGMAQHLVPDRNNIVRICPSVSKRFGLDSLTELQSLKGLGASEARKALPGLRPLFFETKAPNDFTPFHA